MKLNKPSDVFCLNAGDFVTKRNLYDLVQHSKVKGSGYWEGDAFSIGNTPQQGINWVGALPNCSSVIVKARSGSYADDGWGDKNREEFRYSFKARDGIINYHEKANRVLINQPQYGYPIYLFTEHQDGWIVEGAFSVGEIQERYVLLRRGIPFLRREIVPEDESYEEGGRLYVTHLMVERNQAAVRAAKSHLPWVCDICQLNFSDRYGFTYIEAHHRVPVATYSSKYMIKPSGFSLLCPNCHRAVHYYMRKGVETYEEIKSIILDQQEKDESMCAPERHV